LAPGGDKNGADINLALDALEMAFTHPHINAYVIVGGDSDFLSLVEKLKQYDKKVFVVGGRAFTSTILQRNCHEFIAYENLVRKPVARGGRPSPSTGASPITQAIPLVRRALKILADREVSPQTGLLKSTLLQLDSTFSERNYGASSFLDFAEKLAQVGLVQLKHAGRSVMVELNPGFDDAEAQSAEARGRTTLEGDGAAQPHGYPSGAPPSSRVEEPHRGNGEPPASFQPHPEPPSQLGDNAEGVRLASVLLGGATHARRPMYLRNVRQICRAGGFDERRYGFGGLLDVLRACGREGLVRIERDRRGGLRVFQGPMLAVRPPQPRETSELVQLEVSSSIQETEVAREEAPVEPDVIEIQPIAVVDTTAELLGRASPKRPRARATAAAGKSARTAGSAKAAARKPATARRTRTKKAPAHRAGDDSAS